MGIHTILNPFLKGNNAELLMSGTSVQSFSNKWQIYAAWILQLKVLFTPIFAEGWVGRVTEKWNVVSWSMCLTVLRKKFSCGSGFAAAAKRYVDRIASQVRTVASLCSLFLFVTSLGLIFNCQYTVTKFHGNQLRAFYTYKEHFYEWIFCSSFLTQAVNERKSSTLPYRGIKLNVFPRKCVY